ncbi:rhomboid protease [Plasmodium cynomolgi strain B]|uniref:Rhomboid-like protease n=1 Tax=Plasmodium cynomolgi (strain B) TaxID=1120755 RepID=K6VCS7_PLACD|nr:rhomboid protease [Plasmodium cynomolgi strain B]GAB66997.1 rhomboid protease [Plasmodium cynomolgi strain B]
MGPEKAGNGNHGENSKSEAVSHVANSPKRLGAELPKKGEFKKAVPKKNILSDYRVNKGVLLSNEKLAKNADSSDREVASGGNKEDSDEESDLNITVGRGGGTRSKRDTTAAAGETATTAAITTTATAAKKGRNGPSDIKILVTNDEPLHTLPSGAVGRRAPLNPFSSPILGKYRRKNKNAKIKVKDPRLNNNPLVGRLVVCISSTAILFWIFFAEMIFNYNTFNGRCISKVLYPIYTESVMKKREPFFVFLGYGACEYNLEESASDRHFVGTSASDKGWPTNKVEENRDARGESSWDSVNTRVYNQLGGLNTNYIRNYGEIYRLFWSVYLHGGFMHIIFNVICQIQILWIIEPDWGFIRTLILFFTSGVTGNLLSAVCDPCGVTIGSSGALYGLIGALFTYYIEYWKTIPRPCCVVIFMLIVTIFGIFIGMFGYTDNYAHMGGCLGGILYGFATITTVSAADKCTLGERMLTSAPFSWFLSDETKELINAKAREKKIRGDNYRKKQIANKVHKNDALHVMMSLMKNRINEEGRPPCKMKLREWIVRITAASALIILWIVLFVYLLNETAYKSYTPMGQIKFTGVHTCFCCEVNKDKFPFISAEKFYWCFTNEEATKYYCGK